MNGIHGVVKDAETNQPLTATIRIIDYDEDYSVVESQLPFGDFYRPVMTGTYAIEVSADGYISTKEIVTIPENNNVYLDVKLMRETSSVESAKDNCCDDVVDIFPNPVKNVINIKTNSDNDIMGWVMYNNEGQVVMRYTSGDCVNKVDVAGVEKGLYFLIVNIGEKQMVKKVVLE